LDAIFDKHGNASVSCPQSPKRKNSSQSDLLEEITEINFFDLPQEVIHIEEIDIVLSGTNESIEDGRTRSMSVMEELMSHGRTKHGGSINDGNHTVRAHPDLWFTGHINKRHEDGTPPDTGSKDGHHIYTHIAPHKDADIYMDGRCSH